MWRRRFSRIFFSNPGPKKPQRRAKPWIDMRKHFCQCIRSRSGNLGLLTTTLMCTTNLYRRNPDAISSLNPVREARRKSTSVEALAAAARPIPAEGEIVTQQSYSDAEIADRFRLALASLIIRSWRKRRKITTHTIQDLKCYTEAAPKIGGEGFFDLRPKDCSRDEPCSLWKALVARQDLLVKMRDSISETSPRYEDRNRRKVLKQLIKAPRSPLEREDCRWLGDAVFAFFCPEDAVILTTNLDDHRRLAKAIGKQAEKP